MSSSTKIKRTWELTDHDLLVAIERFLVAEDGFVGELDLNDLDWDVSLDSGCRGVTVTQIEHQTGEEE